MLESAGVPYIGHTPLNAALLDDKGNFKFALAGAGLPTAPFLVWNGTKGALDTQSCQFQRVFGDYRGPFIVKPVNGRASQNVEFVQDVAEVPAMTADVGSKTGGGMVLVETFLGGREYCVAVTGDGRGGAFAFAAVERCLEPGEKVFTSMDTRAITADRVRLVDPVSEALLLKDLHDLGRNVFTTFNLTGIVRLDIRADVDGNLFILVRERERDLIIEICFCLL